jgi:hypothetical protein
LDSGSGTVVKNSTRQPKVEGSSLATAAEGRSEKMAILKLTIKFVFSSIGSVSRISAEKMKFEFQHTMALMN